MLPATRREHERQQAEKLSRLATTFEQARALFHNVEVQERKELKKFEGFIGAVRRMRGKPRG